jgi:hypothetical protein
MPFAEQAAPSMCLGSLGEALRERIARASDKDHRAALEGSWGECYTCFFNVPDIVLD